MEGGGFGRKAICFALRSMHGAAPHLAEQRKVGVGGVRALAGE